MAVCSNCKEQSDLILSIKKKGIKLWEYCPSHECLEEAKIQIRSIRDKTACANGGSQEKGGK